jgi:hypothetical protein
MSIYVKYERYRREMKNIQTDLGLQRSSFSDLGLLEDYVFLYNESIQRGIEDLDSELFLKEWKKERRAHIQGIVDTLFLTDKEK